MLGNEVAILPQFKSCTLNVPPQTLQNVTRVLDVNSLNLGNEFMMQNPANVKESQQQAPVFAPDLVLLLRSCRLQLFLCEVFVGVLVAAEAKLSSLVILNMKFESV